VTAHSIEPIDVTADSIESVDVTAHTIEPVGMTFRDHACFLKWLCL